MRFMRRRALISPSKLCICTLSHVGLEVVVYISPMNVLCRRVCVASDVPRRIRSAETDAIAAQQIGHTVRALRPDRQNN